MIARWRPRRGGSPTWRRYAALRGGRSDRSALILKPEDFRRAVGVVSNIDVVLAAKFIAFHRLDQLREASGFLEAAIERELLALATQFRDDAKELSESEQTALAQQVIDRSGVVEETFAQGLRSSLFVSSWSVFEVDLEELAQTLAGNNKIALRPRDLSGRGVRRTQSFFKKVLEVHFPDDRTAWNTVLRLNDLRNVVVHRDGRIARRHDKKLLQLVNSWNSIEIREDQLWYSQDFVVHALEVFGRFWADLFETLRDDLENNRDADADTDSSVG